MIVGIVGPKGAGKRDVIHILKNQKYAITGMRDIVAEEMKEKTVDLKSVQIELFIEKIEKKRGQRYFAKKLNEKIAELKKQGHNDIVVIGLKTTKEIQEVRKNEDFILLGVDAPIEKRFLRFFEEHPEKNKGQTLDEFKEDELQIINAPNMSTYVHHMTDAVVYNDSTLSDLKDRVDYALYHEQKKRPDWDSYFISICDITKSRSTCLKYAAGTILVKDNQILSTAYIGPPRKHPHCDALGGCIMEKRSDISAELCRAAHAEQNAIAQAAYVGISTEGATLYTTELPCAICMRIIVNAGIKKVVYKEFVNNKAALEVAERSGLELIQCKK